MGTGRGIADITPLTLLDFPNKVACIFWLRGCNLFCQYCYNVSLVRGTGSPAGDRTDYLDFLRDRVGFLDGVVLSGGECTLCPDLIPICREIRQLGFAIKIDTNGTRPGVVKALVEEGLLRLHRPGLQGAPRTIRRRHRQARPFPLLFRNSGLPDRLPNRL